MINSRFLSFANGNNVNHHHYAYLIPTDNLTIKLDFVAMR